VSGDMMARDMKRYGTTAAFFFVGCHDLHIWIASVFRSCPACAGHCSRSCRSARHHELGHGLEIPRGAPFLQLTGGRSLSENRT